MISIKKILISINNINGRSKEDHFYKELFINNPTWNKADPNEDEILRWEVIEAFIKQHIIGKTNGKSKLRILDLGCGRGWLTNLLSQYGDVTGLEPIKDVVLYSKKLFPKLEIIHGTSKTLIGSKGLVKFDLVVSSEVIEHIPDSEKMSFVSNIKFLLNEDGYVIITTPRKDAEEQWKKYSDPNQPIEEWMSEFEVDKLFADTGFIKVQMKKVSLQPAINAPSIEIYQLWMFRNL